ncbi:MAG: TonB-dependent receptor [Desulfarculaceae bacterium]|nr:TonB-dependent receptor [Desulfarculaceae bacterium]MCF8074535.1 TonB-dependent receptor [Desulfarculaceae bacterium]MCF8103809.1 TonB-dependent receptor [Desulfarculaceae bacterium]MCF8117817.1 TonB-dependent receptor [Desulfarculaceae bacterium]
MNIPKLLVAAGILCLAVCAAGAAGAQEKAGSAPEAVKLNDTVVTASGQETSSFDTSVPMNVITADSLEERGAVSMEDVFRGEPGLSASTTGPNSVRPMIRGLYDERVLVLINGVRLSEQRPGGNHILSLDPAQIERVEVVRGPASVLYGSDAIAGVINVITKQAPRQTGDKARLDSEASFTGLSDPQGWRAAANLGFGQGRFNGLVGGFYRDNDNVETADYELNNSSFRGGMGWAGGNYLGPRWQADFYYYFMDATMGIPADPSFVSDKFSDEKEHFLSGHLNGQIGGAWADRMELVMGAQRHERNRERLKATGIPAAVQGDMAVNITLDIDTFSLKPMLFKSVGQRHNLVYGLDSFFENATSGRTITDTASSWVNPLFNNVPVIPDSQRLGLGLFAQDEISLAPRWSLTAGLRYDWINSSTDGAPGHAITSSMSQNDSAFSGSLGLLFRATDELNLYANLGRAFRAPTLLERYFYGPHDSSKNDVGDPNLSPETSWNFDVGLKLRTARLGGMFSLFYNRIDNYIAKLDTGSEYTWSNLDQAALYGGELSLDLDIHGGLSAFTTASYVVGENQQDDQDLPSIPPLNGKTGLRYDQELGSGRGWAEFSLLWATEQNRVAPHEKRTGAWARFDFRVGYSLGKNKQIIFSVENLGDRFYYDHLSRTWQDLGLSAQPGRAFKLTLQWSF